MAYNGDTPGENSYMNANQPQSSAGGRSKSGGDGAYTGGTDFGSLSGGSSTLADPMGQIAQRIGQLKAQIDAGGAANPDQSMANTQGYQDEMESLQKLMDMYQQKTDAATSLSHASQSPTPMSGEQIRQANNQDIMQKLQIAGMKTANQSAADKLNNSELQDPVRDEARASAEKLLRIKHPYLISSLTDPNS